MWEIPVLSNDSRLEFSADCMELVALFLWVEDMFELVPSSLKKNSEKVVKLLHSGHSLWLSCIKILLCRKKFHIPQLVSYYNNNNIYGTIMWLCLCKYITKYVKLFVTNFYPSLCQKLSRISYLSPWSMSHFRGESEQ